ncbi:hypothetical protein EBB54_25975 [Schaedlerella arabinosiphila]|uniref:Uncharacterized protein n=1 Tax=Schaedlerella arabinosiphila TaxID=2044587 RepID=A0A3R8M271_9FIRM|nr:hypothetical protein EBB54_25975 [Schaedlerella arabinosiphila]
MRIKAVTFHLLPVYTDIPRLLMFAVTIIEYHVFHMFCNLVLVIFYKILFAELYSVSMENKRILC